MLEIEGLHHISLNVINLEKCKKFYQNVLGLREIERPNFDFNGAWFQLGQQQLHLIVHPTSEMSREKRIDTKNAHFALRVKDYDTTIEILKENHVLYKENIGSKSGFKQIFCMDPDSNLIELNVDGH